MAFVAVFRVIQANEKTEKQSDMGKTNFLLDFLIWVM